jgi:hypothetical protein
MNGQILICFDEIQSGTKVLEAGKKLARVLDAGITVIHIRGESGIAGYYDKLFHQELEQIDSIFGGPGKEELMFVRKYFSDFDELPRFILKSGDPAGMIIAELNSGGYAMAVIGTKDGKTPGAVGQEIIEKSLANVLVVKG